MVGVVLYLTVVCEHDGPTAEGFNEDELGVLPVLPAVSLSRVVPVLLVYRVKRATFPALLEVARDLQRARINVYAGNGIEDVPLEEFLSRVEV